MNLQKSKQLAKWVERWVHLVQFLQPCFTGSYVSILSSNLPRQRKRHQTDAITPEQSKQLTEIGFLFEPNAVKWDAMYEKVSLVHV